MIIVWSLVQKGDQNSPRIMFVLLCHNIQTAIGVVDFINAFYSKDHYYMIHLDKKAKPSVKSYLDKSIGEIPNILQVTRREAEWGKFSLGMLSLHLIRDAYKVSENYPFEVLMFLDGATFPLVSLQELEKRVADLDHKNLLFYEKQRSRKNICEQNDKDLCSRSKSRCIDRKCTLFTLTPQNKPVYKVFS